jgi:hypothetical protein
MQIAGETLERANRIVVSILGDGDDVKRRADVEASGMTMNTGSAAGPRFSFLFLITIGSSEKVARKAGLRIESLS